MYENYASTNKMTGVLQDTIIYRDGRKIDLPADHNIIVNTASMLIAALLKDSFEENYTPDGAETTDTTWPTRLGIKYWAIGACDTGVDSTSSPSSIDSALRNEIYRKEIKPSQMQFLNSDDSVSSDPTNRIRIQIMLDFDEANTTSGHEWFEMGLFGGPTTKPTGADMPSVEYSGGSLSYEGKNTGYMINHKVHPLIGKTNDMKVRRTLVLTF